MGSGIVKCCPELIQHSGEKWVPRQMGVAFGGQPLVSDGSPSQPRARGRGRVRQSEYVHCLRFYNIEFVPWPATIRLMQSHSNQMSTDGFNYPRATASRGVVLEVVAWG